MSPTEAFVIFALIMCAAWLAIMAAALHSFGKVVRTTQRDAENTMRHDEKTRARAAIRYAGSMGMGRMAPPISAHDLLRQARERMPPDPYTFLDAHQYESPAEANIAHGYDRSTQRFFDGITPKFDPPSDVMALWQERREAGAPMIGGRAGRFLTTSSAMQPHEVVFGFPFDDRGRPVAVSSSLWEATDRIAAPISALLAGIEWDKPARLDTAQAQEAAQALLEIDCRRLRPVRWLRGPAAAPPIFWREAVQIGNTMPDFVMTMAVARRMVRGHKGMWGGVFEYDADGENTAKAVREQLGDAGAVAYCITDDEVLLLARPIIHRHQTQGSFHSETGPAIEWPDGTGAYRLFGIPVLERHIRNPETITVAEIDAEDNAEIRRVLIGKFGLERFIRESGAACIDQSWEHTKLKGLQGAKLWRRGLQDDEAIQMLELQNSTPEPDGSIKTYFLRVAPSTRTIREAAAWTFGIEAKDYTPAFES